MQEPKNWLHSWAEQQAAYFQPCNCKSAKLEKTLILIKPYDVDRKVIEHIDAIIICSGEFQVICFLCPNDKEHVHVKS